MSSADSSSAPATANVMPAPESLKCSSCAESTIYLLGTTRYAYCQVMNVIIWTSDKPGKQLTECSSWSKPEQ